MTRKTGIFSGVSAAATLLLVTACQTGGSASAVKGKDGDLYVLVGHDERSATPRPYTKAVVKEMAQKVKAKVKKPQEDVKTQLALAQLALTDGDLAKARDYARKALAIDFRDKEAKVVVAHVAYLERRYEEATVLLNQLGGDNAKDSEVLTLLGCLAWANGDSLRAEQILSKAVTVNGDDVAARMNLGILFLLRENDGGAQTQFAQVLKRIPSNVDARIHLGITLARQGRLAEAQVAYKEARKNAAKNPLLLYNLAVVQKRAGKFDEALSTTKTLMQLRSLTLSEQEQVLVLLDDIRIEKDVNDKSDNGEIEELIADAREKIKSGAAANEDSVIDANGGAVGAH